MNEFPGIPDDERGLVAKYVSFRLPSGRHHYNDRNFTCLYNGAALEMVREPSFLLKFNDKYARVALEAYAEACQRTHPVLADDIRRKLEQTSAENSAKSVEKLRNKLSATGVVKPSDLL